MNEFIAKLENVIFKILTFLRVNEKIAKRIVQFFVFCIVGVGNTIISYSVYSIFVLLKWNYVAGNITGFVVSVTNAFYWNNKYIFRKKEGKNRSLLKAYIKTFTAYGVSGLFLSNILLIFWVEVLGVPEIWGPILNLLVTVPTNFLLNKLWAFKD